MGQVPSDVPGGKNSALAQLVHIKSVLSFEKYRMRKVAEVMLFSNCTMDRLLGVVVPGGQKSALARPASAPMVPPLVRQLKGTRKGGGG